MSCQDRVSFGLLSGHLTYDIGTLNLVISPVELIQVWQWYVFEMDLRQFRQTPNDIARDIALQTVARTRKGLIPLEVIGPCGKHARKETNLPHFCVFLLITNVNVLGCGEPNHVFHVGIGQSEKRSAVRLFIKLHTGYHSNRGHGGHCLPTNHTSLRRQCSQ